MPEHPESELFSEDEVARILKRATEMQADLPLKRSAGLTLAELRQVAEGADIDPRLIAAAALEISGSRDADEANIWGGPTQLTLTRRIRGQVGDETWQRMTSKASDHFGVVGKQNHTGITREWTVAGATATSVRVALHERQDHTELEVFWSSSGIAVAFATLGAVLAVIALPISFAALGLSGAAGFAVYALAMTVFAALLRAGFGKTAASERKKQRLFVDGLVARIEEDRARADILADAASTSSTEATERGSESAQRPRLDVPDAPEIEEAELKGARNRRKA